MAKLSLSMACGDYDRTRAILDGRIAIESCELIAQPMKAEEAFFRAFRHAEFDIAELSFSTYLILTALDQCPYIAIPVFLSRSFRHSGIYVRKEGDIKVPGDLKGRRIGVPEYQVTAAVWTRAFLQQDFGVSPADVTWVTGGVEEPGRHEKAQLDLPSTIRVKPAPEGRTLVEMLDDGSIDALTCPRAPSNLGTTVRRLFDDPQTEAQLYFQRHGHFPIMHVVGIRKELIAEYPWLAGNVFNAFEKARQIAETQLSDTTALAFMLPWLVEEFGKTQKLMGANYWSYGVPNNRSTIEAFLEFHHAQGLSPYLLKIDDIFVRSASEQFKI